MGGTSIRPDRERSTLPHFFLCVRRYAEGGNGTFTMPYGFRNHHYPLWKRNFAPHGEILQEFRHAGGFSLRIQDTRFVVLDTETTGLDPAEDKVVDISLVEVSRNGIQPLYSTLINPRRDIPPTASAVHHITQRGVMDKPMFDEVWPIVMGHLDGAVIVAHNAQFDRSMIPETGRPWICSYRLARHLWPDAPGHSNQVLRYWLDLQMDAEAAHSAAGDTLVTANVFWYELAYYRKHIAKTREISELIEYAASPIPVKVMPFGKHKGMRMDEVPLSYFDWALKNMTELDSDLRITMEQQAAARLVLD